MPAGNGFSGGKAIRVGCTLGGMVQFAWDLPQGSVRQRIEPIIESRPGIERSDLALQGHVLRAIGASLPRDVSVYCVELEPMVRADIASLRMHRELLRIIVANHAGVLTGLDSEFLHDFRVGVRRSRALLGLIKGVLPQAEIDHFKTELSWLGRITGPARDLDVLLLGLRSPLKNLNEDQQHVILVQLEQERARAQQALTEQLTSERYRQLVNRWKEFLSQDARVKPVDGCGALRLVTIVSQRGWRLYRRTLSGIEHVRNDTPAHELHQIASGRSSFPKGRNRLRSTSNSIAPRRPGLRRLIA